MSKNRIFVCVQPFQSIAHWNKVTLRTLSISKEDAKFIQSLNGIINQSDEVAKRVEKNLGLKEGAYKRYNIHGEGHEALEIINDPMLPVYTLSPGRRSRVRQRLFTPAQYVPT